MEGHRVDIAIRRKRNALIVSLDGELDLATAAEVKERVDAALAANAKVNHLIWDLEKVGFIDSSGLAVLLGRYKEIQARSGKVIALRALEPVRRVLTMAGMERIMQFADTEEQALAQIGGKR